MLVYVAPRPVLVPPSFNLTVQILEAIAAGKLSTHDSDSFALNLVLTMAIN